MCQSFKVRIIENSFSYQNCYVILSIVIDTAIDGLTDKKTGRYNKVLICFLGLLILNFSYTFFKVKSDSSHEQQQNWEKIDNKLCQKL